MAGIAVVLHRPSHAFDGLLGAVGGFGVLAAAGNGPKRGLLAIAGPMAFRAHRIPARFMLPVVIAAAHYKSLLRPNNLRADAETLAYEALGDSRGVQGAVPNVGNVAGEQSPCGSPVCLVVVTDLSASCRPVHPQAMTPSRIVIDPIGRIGDHEFGCWVAQQRGDSRRVRTVPTGNPVRAR